MLLMAEKHQVGWSPSDKDVILDRLGSSLTRCALLSQFVPLLLEDETSRASGLFLYLFFLILLLCIIPKFDQHFLKIIIFFSLCAG